MIIVTIITWLFFGVIAYITSDNSYRECLSSGGMFFAMALFGWIPAVIVGADLDEKPESPF